jgi:hypothetical protein
VLYVQMDVWYSLAGFDAEALFASLPQVLARATGAQENDVAEALNASPGLEQLLQNVFTASVPSSLTERYQASVDALASHEPLLAYELSGRAEAPRTIQDSHEKIKAFGAPTNTPEDQPFLDAFNPALARESRKRLISVFEVDIDRVSKLLGRSTKREARAVLARVRAGMKDATITELASAVRELMNRVGLLRGAT